MTHSVKSYDSAYPGSMSEREDGGYIQRDDAGSLAGALLALVESGDRAAEDLQGAVESLEDQLKNMKDFAQDIQDTYDKERARVDWLEQLTDTDVICDIVINWKSRDRKWPAGMRDAIDAAMQSAASAAPTIS